MLKSVSENGRATFSCVPKPARTVGKNPEERLGLIRERVGSIVQIYCGFLDGDVFLPNPVQHTDRIDVVELSSGPESSGWSHAVRENSVTFYDRKATSDDSGHRDSVILVSQKPLNRDVGVFFAPADCAIIGLSHRDPNVDFAALVHSGWKGTAKDVIGKTVEAVKEIFGNAVTADLEAHISPFAKPCCYEFGLDTFSDAFMKGRIPGETDWYQPGIRPLWHRLGTSPNFGLVGRGGKTYLDSSALIHQTLEKSGISEDRTNDLSLCTVCEGHGKGYSSSRKDPNARFGVFMGLKKRTA